ncbi:MAG: ATP-dependent RNA helicase HrpA [Planctomycetota bacterium]
MPATSRQLDEMLRSCTIADRHALRRRLRDARGESRRPRRGNRESVDEVARAIERAVELRAKRAQSVPKVSYPAELPIAQRRDEIAEVLRDHRAVVVCGETGSGKSTQLPKICLDVGLGVNGMIGHTQPRRIAARSVASRVAEELKVPLGGSVGYKVRFGDQSNPETHIKVMTDGVLLNEVQRDRWLNAYDCIIVDEAHERSLNIDFLLGYLRHLLERRDDLKVIVTSATIDPASFSKHFDGAPVIEVSGRTYPVETLYRPWTAEHESREREGQVRAIVDAVDDLASMGQGDVLVFLPGEREIREAAKALDRHRIPGEPHPEILPLYARLSAAEQDRVFKAHGGRRIVLATNVAETSLTVPGIRYVVDTGTARISRYNARSKVQGLRVEPVSKASADQRKGRCGRLRDGVCIRLYEETQFESRPAFTDPEILRSNLASVILQMKALRLGEIETFPFVEPPRQRMIRDGMETLRELGAIDAAHDLTDVGRRLARLPIDPRLGRMILAGAESGALSEVLVIASVLSLPDPRERPMDQRDAADAAHEEFAHPESDFLSLLALWKAYEQHAKAHGSGQVRKWCKRRFVSYLRMREWTDVQRQLRSIVREMGETSGDEPASEAAIHRAILSGLLCNIGRRGDGHEYLGTHGTKFHLFPGSTLFEDKPEWVVAAEMVHTTKIYARTVAKVNAEWIEEFAEHIVLRTHSDPFWARKQGKAMAHERVTYAGLEVIAKRTVPYAKIDRRKARDLFIHHALVRGAARVSGKFFERNAETIEQARLREEKLRRRDLVAEAERLFEFYAARLPDDVTSLRHFERWRKRIERDDPDLLMMAEADVLNPGAPDASMESFPDGVEVSGQRLDLQYKFAPGEQDDGVSLRVPLSKLTDLTEAACDWAVPAMVPERVKSLLKGLPKDVRRAMGPAPNVAERFAESEGKRGDRPLMAALNEFIARERGGAVDASAWMNVEVPEHQRLRVIVTDADGKGIAASRDLALLKRELAGRIARELEHVADGAWNRTGITSWDFGDLPESVRVRVGETSVLAYPAIEDAGRSVALRVRESVPAARETSRNGLRRLFAIAVREELKYRLRERGGLESIKLKFATLGSAGDLLDQIGLAIVGRAFLADDPDIRTQRAFEQRLDAGYGDLEAHTAAMLALVAKIIDDHHRLRLRLDDLVGEKHEAAARDMEEQVEALFCDGFLADTPPGWLAQFPRYVASIGARLDRVRGSGVKRDGEQLARIAPYIERWRVATAQRDRLSVLARVELRGYRWLLEEYRVQLFTQDLGTAVKVSSERLDEQWGRVVAAS